MATEFAQTYKECFFNSLSITVKVAKHKRELADLICQEITNDEKVAKLKTSILVYRKTLAENHDSTLLPKEVIAHLETHESLNNDMNSKMSSKMMAIHQMECLTQIMEKGTICSSEHECLLAKIKEFLLCELSPNEKISKIGDLLL